MWSHKIPNVNLFQEINWLTSEKNKTKKTLIYWQEFNIVSILDKNQNYGQLEIPLKMKEKKTTHEK